MHGKVILISDDNNFFEYIVPKLMLRKSDELRKLQFDDLIDNIDLLANSLLIVNCENNEEKTIELLKIVKDNPVIVFGYNDNEQFKIEAYKNGMFGYFTLSSTPEEINALIMPALKVVSTQHKCNIYKDLLIKNNLLTKNNGVFLDYNTVLDKQIENMKKTSSKAVLMAISPNDKSKFLINPNQIETVVKNYIRENDVLMNFAPNKYFLLLNNTDTKCAKLLWKKINNNLPNGIFAGITSITRKNRQNAINDAINKLQKAINQCDKSESNNVVDSILHENIDLYTNFKLLKQDYSKKFEQIIYPTFYKVQQIYNDKLFGINIQPEYGKNNWTLVIKSENISGIFKITNPGYFAVNIDISYMGLVDNEQKRITLEQDELEEGLLTDLIEQFILEFKHLINGGICNDYS